MDLSEKIKELIADGKTQKAIDLLQEFLRERDTGLLNQTYLLENQYNELSRKQQQGLLESPAELNRVSLALLNLCDEARKLDPDADFDAENRRDTEGGGFEKKAGLILVVVVVVVVGIVFALIKYVNKGDTPKLDNSETNEAAKNLSPAEATLPAGQAVRSWRFEPSRIFTLLNNNSYGRQGIHILSETQTIVDNSRKQLDLKIRLTCEQTTTGSCMTNYVMAQIKTKDKVFTADPNPLMVDITAINASSEVVASFIVPLDFAGGELLIFYLDAASKGAKVTILPKD
jgi:hypothetical protein